MRNRKDPFSLRLSERVIQSASEVAEPLDQSTSWALRKMIEERVQLADAGLRINDREAVDGLCILLKSPGFDEVIKGFKQASKDELDIVRGTLLDLIRKAGIG
ncbi:MAG: hypothetical protein KC944_19345 [Candidatus Omnitrophica bacterium]|nr:hypothetical protein [Candidatus Omnitrophota bacterium]